ncbi:MAG: Rne/Rng family ribonuclease [Cryomorphaceae bacterium]|nr:Rne/Rng family ribonuclease [Cryomorphaceae bacterium]
MNAELFIHSRNADGLAIALLKDGKLTELHTEEDNRQFLVGDVYVGKVKRIATGLNAAFVDVGYSKDAFLHYHDLGPQFLSLDKFYRKVTKGKQVWNLAGLELEKDIEKNGTIDQVLKTSQNVVVQIAKEPISTKGPRITSEISLAGRYVVLVPFSDRISISQKIRDRKERDRLRNLLKETKPPGFGIIIRTVANEVERELIEGDLRNLVQRWKQLHRQITRAKAPGRVLQELGAASALLRDVLNDSFSNIVVDEQDKFDTIKLFLEENAPDKVSILKLYKGELPMFERFGIERQIKTSFGRSVSAGKGTYLIIEHTEAMHVIDVNSGNRASKSDTQEENALAVNLLAAEEIARQLRLRDMGGIIVVDFIDMHKAENRKAVYEKLRDQMKGDRAKHKILPPSKFGLVEITRQRVRPEMNIDTREANPDGAGKVEAPIALLDDIEIEIEKISNLEGAGKFELHVHPFLEAYINKGWLRSLRKQWQKKHKCKLKVVPRDGYKFLEYRFFNSGEEVQLPG